MNADVHQRRRHPVGVRVGVGVLEAAGVGGQAGIQAFGHTAVQRGFQEPDYREYQHSGGRSARVQQQKAGIGGVGAVVIDAQIYVFRPAAPQGAQQPDVGHIHRTDKGGLKGGRRHPCRHIVVFLRNGVRALHPNGFAKGLESAAQGIGGAQRIPVGILMGQQ